MANKRSAVWNAPDQLSRCHPERSYQARKHFSKSPVFDGKDQQGSPCFEKIQG